MYRSIDAGASWAQVRNAIGGETPGNICFKPNNPNIVYASIYNTVYKSIDAGATWSVVTALSTTSVRYWHLAVTPANPDLLFAAKKAQFTFEGLFLSSDDGTSFNQISSGSSPVSYPCSPSSNSNLASQLGSSGGILKVAVSPTNANKIYIGQVFMCSSSDGGATWATIQGCDGTNTPYVDNHDIKFHPTTEDVYVGCDGGLHRYLNATNTWEILHYNLPVALQYALAVSPNGNRILVGNQDVQTFIYDRPSSTWNYATGTQGDGQQPAFAPTNSNICYASMQSGAQLHKSTDGGTTFTTLTQSSAMLSGFTQFKFTALQVHPTDPNTLFVGKGELFKTTDGGTNWTKISDFAALNTGFTPTCWCIKVALSNPDIIYVSNNVTGKLFKTIDGGVNWTQCAHPNALYFMDIDIHNTNPNIIWGVTYSRSVWKSTDGGSSWVDYSGGLSSVYKNTIVFQKNTNEGVYIGTDVGVYYRDNTMSDWEAFDTGLPNAIVYDLEIDYANNKILAATHGRGTWESPLFSVVLPVELVTFDAMLTGKKVNLRWQTATETNLKNFDIEKSTDGQKFEKISEVKANNTPSLYQAFDNDFSASAYYRLKINDLDGKTDYSKVVYLEKSQSKLAKIRSNTEGSIWIETDALIESIQVVNTIGQVVKTTKDKQFSIADLPKGIYVVVVKTSKGFVSEKVLSPMK